MAVMHKELSKVLRTQQGTKEKSLCPYGASILGGETDNTQKRINRMYSLPYVLSAIRVKCYGAGGEGPGKVWGRDCLQGGQ